MKVVPASEESAGIEVEITKEEGDKKKGKNVPIVGKYPQNFVELASAGRVDGFANFLGHVN